MWCDKDVFINFNIKWLSGSLFLSNVKVKSFERGARIFGCHKDEFNLGVFVVFSRSQKIRNAIDSELGYRRCEEAHEAIIVQSHKENGPIELRIPSAAFV